jgi:hypothetical protein
MTKGKHNYVSEICEFHSVIDENCSFMVYEPCGLVMRNTKMYTLLVPLLFFKGYY